MRISTPPHFCHAFIKPVTKHLSHLCLSQTEHLWDMKWATFSKIYHYTTVCHRMPATLIFDHEEQTPCWCQWLNLVSCECLNISLRSHQQGDVVGKRKKDLQRYNPQDWLRTCVLRTLWLTAVMNGCSHSFQIRLSFLYERFFFMDFYTVWSQELYDSVTFFHTFSPSCLIYVQLTAWLCCVKCMLP